MKTACDVHKARRGYTHLTIILTSDDLLGHWTGEHKQQSLPLNDCWSFVVDTIISDPDIAAYAVPVLLCCNLRSTTFTLALYTIVMALLYSDQNLMAPNLSAIAEDFGFSDEVCTNIQLSKVCFYKIQPG